MWSLFAWSGAIALCGIAIVRIAVLKSTSRHKPPQVVAISFMLCVLICIFAAEKVLSASNEDFFQQVLNIAGTGGYIRFDRDDALAFLIAKWLRRFEAVWAILTFLAYVPYSQWEMRLWRNSSRCR